MGFFREVSKNRSSYNCDQGLNNNANQQAN